MKKFLLSLCALLCIGSILAAEQSYTISFKNAENNNGTTTPKISDVVSEGDNYITSFSGSLYYTGMYGLRLGQNKKTTAKLTIALSKSGIVDATKIVIEASANKNPSKQILGINGTAITLDESSTTNAYKLCEVPVTGQLSEITLETKRTTTGSSSEGFIYIHSISVYYDSEGGSEPTPVKPRWSANTATVYLESDNNEFPVFSNPENLYVLYDSSNPDVATIDEESGEITLVGAGETTITAITDEEENNEYSYTLIVRVPNSKDNPYTVADVIANNNGSGYVKGYIVGSISGGWTDKGCLFGTANAVNTNMMLADNPDETDHNKCIPVELPSGDIRTALNLKDNPDNYTELVILHGNLTAYFGTKGLKGVDEYIFVNRPVLPEGAFEYTVDGIGEDGNVTLVDGKAEIIFSGVHKEVKIYFKHEAAAAAEPVVRKALDHSGFEAATYDEAADTHKITLTQPGTLTYYAAHDASGNAEDPKTITVKAADPTTGIGSIAADDAEGKVEYFNLQGVKVNIDNAAPGLYIRRQGNTVSKVIL